MNHYRAIVAVLIASLPTIFTQYAMASDPDAEQIKTDLEERLAVADKIAPLATMPWWDRAVFSGLVEIQAGYSDTTDGQAQSSSDLRVATLKLGVQAQLTDQLNSTVIVLYEQDETALDVEVATIEWVPVDDLAIKLGQDYVPFGVFETLLVNDTLVLELAQTRDTLAQLTWQHAFPNADIAAAIYVFDGDADDSDHINQYGISFNYATDHMQLGVDYLSNILDSETLAPLVRPGNNDRYGAMIAHGELAMDSFILIAEYLRSSIIAADVFGTAGDIKPEALQLEIAWMIDDYVIAGAYQATNDAEILALPKRRYSLGINKAISNNIELGLEYWRDNQYRSVASSRSTSHSVVGQIAVRF